MEEKTPSPQEVPHPKWNNKEFCAFLLLYSAMADNIITSEERDMVLEKVEPEVYDQLLDELNANTEEENKAILLSYKGIYFPTLAQKKELLHLVKKEFYADKDFSAVEIELYNTLKSIM